MSEEQQRALRERAALDAFDRALGIDPTLEDAFCSRFSLRMYRMFWRHRAADLVQLRSGGANGRVRGCVKAFYGAAYTVVIYQAGTLLGDYRSCTQGFGEPQAAACKQAAISENYANTTNTTGIEYVMEEVAFDYPTIACCLLVVLWAYCGAIHYTLNDKNASSPAFIWLPVYEAERYTIKTFLSGAGSMFKSFPYVIMPTYLVGFSLALYLTFSYQPCQGQGRKGREAVVALQDIHLVVGERVDRRLEH